MLSESLQLCKYCIPSLTRLCNVLVFCLSMTSVSQFLKVCKSFYAVFCVCLIWFIWIYCWRSFWASLLIDCNFLHRFVDALSEPASVRVCFLYVSIFLRSLRTGTFICVCVCVCVCVCCRSLRANICWKHVSADALFEPASFIDAPSILCFFTESNSYGC